MAVTRIQNNQIFDKTITYAKIADGTLVGSLFNPNLLLNSNVTIQGNLSVLGDSTTITSTNTFVNDPLVVFNNGYTGLPSYDVGILINRNLNGPQGPYNTAWIWNEANAQFEGIFTTETGGTTGTIDNHGWTNVKVGNVVAVTSATIAAMSLTGSTITATGTNANLTLSPDGSGTVTVTAPIMPATSNVFALGSSAQRFTNIYGQTVDLNGATISTNSGDLLLTPNGGSTIVANLSISGTGSTFTGNVVSGNVTVTGGTINGTTIGGVTPGAATVTSLVDTGALTANGANAPISLAPTGTGTVTIAPATTGSISNMAGSLTTLTTSSTTTLAATSATSLSTANLVATGGTATGVTITSSPISGSTGSFTTLAASSTSTLATVDVSGIETISNTTQSTAPANGALIVAGGVGVGKDVSVGGNIRVAQSTTLGTIVVDAVGDISSTSTINISSNAAVQIGLLTYPQTDGTAGAVMVTNGAGVLTLSTIATALQGNLVPLGTPTDGALTNNSPALTNWTSATTVTDALDKLNELVGLLVPPSPGVFPNATPLSVTGLSSGLRMTDFTQTNNTTTGSKQLTAGSTVSAYKRVSSYATNTISNTGPGTSGTLSVMKDGTSSGSHIMVSGTANGGTYSDLVISNNVDYSTITGKSLGFWTSFSSSASGTVAAGWNEVYMTDTAGSATNTVGWYYDASAPGTPVVTASTFAPTTAVTSLSSSVPHYTSTTVWTATGTATKLSGDLYPATDTFLTGSAGGRFSAPASVTYTSAGVTTPLAQNLYVVSGSAAWTTTTTTVNTTGSSSSGPSFSVNNSYATGTGSATPGGTVLTIKANDTSVVDENYITVGTFGTGGAATAVRVGGLSATATPTTGSITSWASASALATTDAAVVAGVLSCNTTNYSTGYFPVGPDLSTQASTQYATFRITRDATSKFDISVTGKFAACHVAMPGSSLDTTASPTNGWIDATTAYSGSGVPGTGTGGNGSAGCALGGPLAVGTSTTQSKTVTFGTESSNHSTGNYIYVRFTLVTGDSITALSFPNPAH